MDVLTTTYIHLGVLLVGVLAGLLLQEKTRREAYEAGKAESESLLKQLKESNTLASDYHEFANMVANRFELEFTDRNPALPLNLNERIAEERKREVEKRRSKIKKVK